MQNNITHATVQYHFDTALVIITVRLEADQELWQIDRPPNLGTYKFAKSLKLKLKFQNHLPGTCSNASWWIHLWAVISG